MFLPYDPGSNSIFSQYSRQAPYGVEGVEVVHSLMKPIHPIFMIRSSGEDCRSAAEKQIQFL